MIEATDLVFKLSGGASNTDQAQSLGGIISANSPLSQTFTQTGIPGITIATTAGLMDGDAMLKVDPVNDAITLTTSDGFQGLAIGYTGNGDRSYYLTGGAGVRNGYMVIDVVEASLPTILTTDYITISTPNGGIFPDVTMAQATTGITQHRCLYITNTHQTDSIVQIGLYLIKDTDGPDTVYYAIDTDAGVVDGTTNTAVVLPEETDSGNLLTNLTFESNTDHTQAQIISATMLPGESLPIWLRRVVPQYVDRDVVDNGFTVGIKAYLGA